MEPMELMKLAAAAMDKAYAPYSGVRVGAALLGRSGRVYTGCNVENAAFSPTCCAERTALFKAVSEGEREFSALAVTGGRDGAVSGLFPPCGVCRQVLLEFCDPDLPIYLTEDGTTLRRETLGALAPLGFTVRSMEGEK